MKKLFLPVLPLLIALFLISCEEDFEINAPYKDITVVYGLIDQGEDSIFIKINKAFLGDGNVMEMAKIEDSSVYVNGLEAIIQEINGDTATFLLNNYVVGNKDTGIFYNPYQIIYYTPCEPKQDRDYRLEIMVNGDTISATTKIVRNFDISKPSAGSNFIQFRPDTDGEVEWRSAVNGRRYEVVIRINYKEVWLDDPDTVFRYVDWNLGTKKSKSIESTEDMNFVYNNNSFYTILQDRVPYADASEEAKVLERYTNKVDVIIAVAGEELNTYMEVNEPSNSIVQDKPDYTNITNGIGLFSSRFKNIRTKKVHPETIVNIKLIAPELKFVY